MAKEANYVWVGNKLISETRDMVITDLEIGNYFYHDESYTSDIVKIKVDYLYGITGITGFTLHRGWQSKNYYFQKNILGDVEKIYNEHNELVAEYNYDAWGNCTILKNVNNIATLNAIRYRSYYWDNDLKMYYLESRYYDAEIGRFINADSIKYVMPNVINGLNLYAYCHNNPIKYTDCCGEFFLFDWIDKAVNWVGNNVVEPVVGFVGDIAIELGGSLVEGFKLIGDVINNGVGLVYQGVQNLFNFGASTTNSALDTWDELGFWDRFVVIAALGFTYPTTVYISAVFITGLVIRQWLFGPKKKSGYENIFSPITGNGRF